MQTGGNDHLCAKGTMWKGWNDGVVSALREARAKPELQAFCMYLLVPHPQAGPHKLFSLRPLGSSIFILFSIQLNHFAASKTFLIYLLSGAL